MDWFRYYTDTLESHKIQTLPPPLFRAWVNLLCIARIYDGVIPNTDEVAYRLRCSNKQATTWLNELLRRRLLDETEHGELVPHDWNEHQKISDDAAARMRRARKSNMFRTCSEHVPNESRTCSVLEQNRADQIRTEQTQSRVFVPELDDRAVLQKRTDVAEIGRRWLDGYKGRKADVDGFCRAWMSCFKPEDEEIAFACRDRYNSSDEVARGVLQEAGKFVFQQAGGGWLGTWPQGKAISIADRTKELAMRNIERTGRLL